MGDRWRTDTAREIRPLPSVFVSLTNSCRGSELCAGEIFGTRGLQSRRRGGSVTDDQIAARLTARRASVAKQLRLTRTLGELRSLTSTIHVTFYT